MLEFSMVVYSIGIGTPNNLLLGPITFGYHILFLIL